MLQIEDIRKQYTTGELTQTALDGVSLAFRDSEFVAVLGPSGSGKTTLLNIIGGLDRYDSGNLIINGISTKKYSDRDWDSYRNHTIGFVFQSYNLIPHQSVLANVELALTISGITRAERKKRATEALKKVGLGDQLHKRPNQMSGGQMQRVAIARALVNDPDILLADEPTGALDTETSRQVLDLLKEVAKDRLVVMVTHNGELADLYATRIVKLRDGCIIHDSAPYAPEETVAPTHKNMGRSTMSFKTAVSLSLNNLWSKKGRTLLTAIAGSIGIIGIALILSLSTGINNYIDQVQKDTLSTYPISIQKETIDMTGMMATMMEHNLADDATHDPDAVYSNDIMLDMLSSISAEVQTNDLGAFKEYMESDKTNIADYVTAIQYGYDLELQIYSADTADKVTQLNPSSIFSNMMGSFSMGTGSMASMGSFSFAAFEEMLGNTELLEAQYDVLAGRWPDAGAYDEVVIVVNENNEISDMALYQIGLLDADTLNDKISAIMRGETVETEQAIFSYDEILGTTFKLVLNTDYYVYDEATGGWTDMREDAAYMAGLVDSALELKVVGILRPNEEASATALSGTVGYTSALTDYVVAHIHESEIVQAQLADPETNVFTNFAFDVNAYLESLTMDDLYAMVTEASEEEQAQFQAMIQSMGEETVLSMISAQIKANAANADSSSYEQNLTLLGYVDLNKPSAINIYCLDFESKDAVGSIIDDYNKMVTDAGNEELVINYTDLVGLMMSSITTIINIISYVLIGFVAISLVVSSIMIAIITYISVLERTKEIGILRSIGASKGNISSIFNAETLIEGFAAGAVGILITLLLMIPINAIIKALTGVSNITYLPLGSALILIGISVVLNVLAGLIPARIAAKKDPVVALRTE